MDKIGEQRTGLELSRKKKHIPLMACMFFCHHQATTLYLILCSDHKDVSCLLLGYA